MNKQELKNTSTDTAIEILKTYPEFRFYHEYIEKRLAGDFAFDLVNLLLKNRKENEQLKSNLEASQESLKEHMQALVKCEKQIESHNRLRKCAESMAAEAMSKSSFYKDFIRERDNRFAAEDLHKDYKLEIKDLEAQIEKMKNCLNCKNYRIGCNLCVGRDGWELKEAD